MKMLSAYLIFACTVAIGESVPHNWRYSKPSYHSYRPQRWRYNPYRQHHSQGRGHTPYHHFKKTHGKGVGKHDGTAEESMKIIVNPMSEATMEQMSFGLNIVWQRVSSYCWSESLSG